MLCIPYILFKKPSLFLFFYFNEHNYENEQVQGRKM